MVWRIKVLFFFGVGISLHWGVSSYWGGVEYLPYRVEILNGCMGKKKTGVLNYFLAFPWRGEICFFCICFLVGKWYILVGKWYILVGKCYIFWWESVIFFGG